MTTLPAPKKKAKLTDLSRIGVDVVVWLGPADGSAPDRSHLSEFLRPLRWERVSGGTRVNVAVLQYDLGRDQEHVIDTLTPKAINRQVELRERDYLGNYKRILAWGKLAAQPIDLGDGESVQYIVRMDKHLFGQPLGKVPFWTPTDGGKVVQLDRPLTFNPQIDETVKGNKSNKFWTARDSMSVWFDAATVNNAAARAAHEQTPTKWKLYEAVHALLWLCNPDETWIKNLSLAECFIQLQEVDYEDEVLKNLPLESGQYLPELLDALLTRYGCSWTIDLVEGEPEGEALDGPCERRFRFFRRNHGTERKLYLQRPGSQVDPVKSSVKKLAINFDIANLANKIIGCTSRKQREITIELYKAWPVSEDGTTKEEFESSSATYRDHPHAIRKWVVNENGSVTGLRPEIDFFRDLSTFFGGDDTLPVSRKFLDCLSRVKDGASDTLESRGIFVEWLDPADATWKRVPWSYSNLQLECGIYFETFPQELWDALQDDPDTARVRVTATIEGDLRTYATATRVTSSPNADDVTLRLNLEDKFHDRAVHSSSIYYADRATADEMNDAVRLQAYVEQVRRLEDAAELSCSAVLEGIDHAEYQIGDLITTVDGRNLQLNRNNGMPGVAERYLQVMGITCNISASEGQSTELLLESFDEEQTF